ncbi:MAG TPA: hypothetical protein VGC42_12435 [Kofleriaceae bacterium]
MRPWLLLTLGLGLAGCSSGDDGPPLTSATSLACPYPGALPFRLPTSGFEKSINADTVATEHQSKDQAFDILGASGGVEASVGIDDAAAPAMGNTAFAGLKARTTPTGGLLADSLPGEHVSLWFYDEIHTAWQQLGTAVTDDSGRYSIAPSIGIAFKDGTPFYAMLDADGSCAAAKHYVYPPGTKVVVADIDGTLTTDDNQILMQGADETYVPAMMADADAMTRAWHDRGYPVIYLTARPHLLEAESRAWLGAKTFADGALITQGSSKPADVYKTLWLQRMITSFGWQVVAAYGNAQTDITAYANVGIDPKQTFIIGPLAGNNGTIAIPDLSYTAHIRDYVMAQPQLTFP